MRCALLILFAAIPLVAASDVAELAQAAALIRSLDDEDFETRQRSESALEAFGSAIVPLLKQCADAKSVSFESQTRCRRIVQNIALTEKIAAMLKEPDGYSKLLEFAGEQQQARRMGAARAICVRAAPLLLKLAETDAQNASTHREHAEYLETCAQAIENHPLTVRQSWEWADPQMNGQVVFLPACALVNPANNAGPDLDVPGIDIDQFILNVNFDPGVDVDIDDLKL